MAAYVYGNTAGLTGDQIAEDERRRKEYLKQKEKESDPCRCFECRPPDNPEQVVRVLVRYR